jgi:hypothetical protein
MIEDSTKEFHTASSGEEGSDLSSPRCGTGVPPTPVTTTPWMENAPAAQALMTVLLWVVAPGLDIGIPFEQWRTHHEGQRAQTRTRRLSAEQEAAQR